MEKNLISLKEIKERLNELSTKVDIMMNMYESKIETSNDERQESAFKVVDISTALLSYRLMPKLKGFNYIKSATELIMKDNNAYKITKDIYPIVAKQYGVTSSRVERAIRHAIQVMRKSNTVSFRNDFKEFNGNDNITNSEFLSVLALNQQKQQNNI